MKQRLGTEELAAPWLQGQGLRDLRDSGQSAWLCAGHRTKGSLQGWVMKHTFGCTPGHLVTVPVPAPGSLWFQGQGLWLRSWRVQ